MQNASLHAKRLEAFNNQRSHEMDTFKTVLSLVKKIYKFKFNVSNLSVDVTF